MSLNSLTRGVKASLILGVCVAALAMVAVMTLQRDVKNAKAASTLGSPIPSVGLSPLESMSALQSQPPAASRLQSAASDVTEMTSNPPTAGDAAGTIDPQRGYTLLSKANGATVDLIAFPTSANKLCYEMSDGNGGCLARFTPELPVDWRMGQATPSSGASVTGLFPDAVTAISVRAGGQLYPVSLGPTHSNGLPTPWRCPRFKTSK